MRPSTVESLKKSLCELQQVLIDGGPFADRAEEAIDRTQAKLFLLEFLVGQLEVGLTLKHCMRDAWGIILPDASQPGRFRWQAFQRDGFTGRNTFDSMEECLGDLVDDGYGAPDPGALDRVADTVEWRRGMEIVGLIQSCNAGLLSFENAMQQREEIYARYQAAAKAA
ncbi:hypothetical protein HNP46_007081 [Pseudomonas nitritireducens]|uniref:Uncharacterized protein n=1 Tax=Pseudomonas nitroreducens TaxID=46680 RepID=A0A7W7P4Z6_PSENT|nr:hypothetical protein [Pseudomonas nitritireducens]MBB4868161.1 hypothetical protein [Pseudomonas nitritireducens]